LGSGIEFAQGKGVESRRLNYLKTGDAEKIIVSLLIFVLYLLDTEKRLYVAINFFYIFPDLFYHKFTQCLDTIHKERGPWSIPDGLFGFLAMIAFST